MDKGIDQNDPSHLIVKLPWRIGDYKEVVLENVVRITLYANSPRRQSTDFLEHFPQLETLVCVNRKPIDLSGVRFVQGISRLYIASCLDYIGLEADYFKCLRLLSVHCGKGSPNQEWIMGLKSLFELDISNASAEMIHELTLRNTIKTLKMTHCGVKDLQQEIGGLRHVRKLDISRMPKLTRIGGVDSYRQLSKVKISKCRNVNDIDVLAEIAGLTFLLLEATPHLDSLSAAAFLKQIRYFVLLENAGIQDKNMHPLLSCPLLEWVAYVNKSGYSMKDYDIRSKLGIETYSGEVNW